MTWWLHPFVRLTKALKASKRKGYATYYEPETREIVGDVFEVDVKHFDYEF